MRKNKEPGAKARAAKAPFQPAPGAPASSLWYGGTLVCMGPANGKARHGKVAGFR
jgi:hypothetical protein